MIKLHIGFMRELKNYEFAVLIRQVAKSLSQVEANQQPLKQVAERMQHHFKEIYYLEDQKPSHPLTEVIGALTQKRTSYLISLRLQIEGKMLSHKKEEQDAANHLHNWIHKYRKYLYVASIIPQTGRIMGVLSEMKRTPIIKQSLIDLRLDDLLEAIEEVTKQVDKKESLRMKDKPLKSRKGKDLRRAAYADMHLLVNILDVMMAVDPEKTKNNIYYDLTLSIKQHLKNSHTILKSRTTKRENKKNLASAVSKLVRTTNRKEKAVIPNKDLMQLLSEEYVKKENGALVCSMAEAEGEVKGSLLIKETKRKAPIGKDWKWWFPQIGVN